MTTLATVVLRNTHLLSGSLMVIGLMLGGWLALKPKQLLDMFFISDDETSNMIVQIIGQILLGLIIAPLMLRFLNWLYF